MSASILTSVKQTLGLAEDHTAFDAEIMTFINSVIADLTQLGVGPSEGFEITSSEEIWTDLLGTNLRLNMVKGYIYKRVKLLFDPPEIGFVLTAMKEQINKDEWRINVEIDSQIPDAVVVPEEV